MNDKEKYRNTLKYIGLGTQWMVLLLVAVWGGWKIDNALEWKFPLFTILLPLISLIVSLWQIIKAFNKPKK